MDILIIKNSAFNLGYRGFNVLYPLITTAYISRIFLADGVGEIAFAVNIVTYFTLAASLGIPNYAIKVLAPVKNDTVALNRRFSELSSFIFISSLVCTLLYYLLLVWLFGHDTSEFDFDNVPDG